MTDFTHMDARGRLRMVDVGDKEISDRCAVAEASVRMAPATRKAILDGNVAKGNALEAARLAGIGAAKRTAELIPLCHTIALTHVAVDFDARGDEWIAIRAEVRARDRTGVEMEALTAAAVAALTLYDMCKAVDRGMIVEGLRLVEKRGGVSGTWRREGPASDE